MTWAKIAEVDLRPSPISLGEAVVVIEITEALEPVPVEAWMTFETPTSPVKVDGRAVRWTKLAVLIEFELPDETRREAWVWASAVNRRGEQ